MMQQNKNVPELRFPEFSGEWKTASLNDFVTPVKRTLKSFDGEVLTISAGKGFISQKERFSQVIAGNSLEKYTLLYKDEFSYNRGNSKSYTYGCVYKLQGHEKALVPNIYRSFSLDKGVPSFFEQLFIGHKLDRQLRRLISSSARMDGLLNIGQEDFYKCKTVFPDDAEQQKIADFLSAVDERIEGLRRKEELLKDYKKGVMQQIFSQKIRFKQQNGQPFPDWQEKKLGDIATATTGSSNREDSTETGQYAFFDRSNDTRASSKYIYDCEAIIVAGEGKDFPPKYFVGKFDLHQRAYAVMNFGENNGKFIYYMIDKNKYFFLRNSVGSTMPSLRMQAFTKFPLNLPHPDEQQKIADFLSSIDEKIEAVSNQLEKAQTFKKGLLQKMFV